MMARKRFLRLVMLVLLAPAGLLAGHSVSHARSAPHAEPGAATLIESSHLWWALAAVAVVMVAVGGVGLVRVSRLQRMADVSLLTSLELYAGLATRLAGWQLGMFVLVEVVERHTADHTTSLLVHGTLAQLVLAVVLTAAVWVLAVEAERFRVIATRPWRLPAVPRRRAVRAPLVRPRLLSGRPVGSRAPPLPS